VIQSEPLDLDRTDEKEGEEADLGLGFRRDFSGEAWPEMYVANDAEPPGASRGDDKVRSVEWSLMVVAVVQIGPRWHVGGWLELAESAEVVRAILTMRTRSCCRVLPRRERVGKGYL
jgi:hypothetical protein